MRARRGTPAPRSGRGVRAGRRLTRPHRAEADRAGRFLPPPAGPPAATHLAPACFLPRCGDASPSLPSESPPPAPPPAAAAEDGPRTAPPNVAPGPEAAAVAGAVAAAAGAASAGGGGGASPVMGGGLSTPLGASASTPLPPTQPLFRPLSGAPGRGSARPAWWAADRPSVSSGAAGRSGFLGGRGEGPSAGGHELEPAPAPAPRTTGDPGLWDRVSRALAGQTASRAPARQVECFRRVNSGGQCGAPRGEEGRKARCQG